ncbi:MAG: TraB/GumN family protein [Burkholderiales bacterium]|nr:TraB/GumN family protein [Burkholderiales bacterium]MBI3731617.1 TraB/GumN family protein [Burkholderiales bacterium]
MHSAIQINTKLKFQYFLLFAFIFYCKNIYASGNAVEDSVLWRLSRGHEVINILGVTHVGFEKQYPVDKAIVNALNASGAMMIESNVIIESNQQVKERLLKAYRAESQNTTLEELLKSSYCDKISKEQKTLGNISSFLGPDLLPGLLKSSPRALIHQLYSHQSPLTEFEVKELKVAEPLELNLVKYAIQSNKKIMSLDPEFWDSIDALNEIEKCDLLVGMAYVYSSDKYKKRTAYEVLGKLKSLWFEGNSSEMRRQEFLWLNENTTLFSNNLSNWFSIRNRLMVDKIIKASSFKQSELFVILGAAHLSGNDGVIARLKRMGFDSQPIHVGVSE